MGALAAPLLAVGSGVMTYMSGRQQAAGYDAQAQAQEQNAAIAERNRQTAADQAARQQQEARQRYNLIQGQNTAALAAGGLESGSSLGAAFGRANANAFERDSRTINENLANVDLNYRQNIYNAQAAAANYRSAAKMTRKMSLLGGIMTTAQGLYSSSLGGKASKGSDNFSLDPYTLTNAGRGKSMTFGFYNNKKQGF